MRCRCLCLSCLVFLVFPCLRALLNFGAPLDARLVTCLCFVSLHYYYFYCTLHVRVHTPVSNVLYIKYMYIYIYPTLLCAELRPVPYWGWYPTSSRFLVALFPRDTYVDNGAFSSLRPSVTFLPRSLFSDDSASDPDAEVNVNAVSLSRIGHVILALAHAVTAGASSAANSANAAAGVGLCSTPASLPVPALAAAEAAGAGVLGSDEQLVDDTRLYAVGRGSRRRQANGGVLSDETSPELPFNADWTHVARSPADDAVEDTQTRWTRSRSAEPEYEPGRRPQTAHTQRAHFLNVAWATNQQQNVNGEGVQLERNHEGSGSEAHSEAHEDA